MTRGELQNMVTNMWNSTGLYMRLMTPSEVPSQLKVSSGF